MIGNMEVLKFESSKKYIKFYERIKEMIVTCGTQKVENDNKKCVIMKDDDLVDDRVADDIN